MQDPILEKRDAPGLPYLGTLSCLTPLALQLTDILVEGAAQAMVCIEWGHLDGLSTEYCDPLVQLSTGSSGTPDAIAGAGQFEGGIVQLSVLTALRNLRLRGFSMAQGSGGCLGVHCAGT